jgi:hypothetical protein
LDAARLGPELSERVNRCSVQGEDDVAVADAGALGRLA